MTPLRHVAVVGAGPSGVYTAEQLAKVHGLGVDVFDRLPTPYGLLRYGVAPDHLTMKRLTATLEKALLRPGIRFFGNVEIGRDVTAKALRERYDAVVYAVGAPDHHQLGLPGEELPGVLPAGDFVSWYSGHPDAAPVTGLGAVRSAVVVGAGNVALDVARVLARATEEMAATDIPDEVLAELAGSAVRDIHVVARRGPGEVRFTAKELAEFGELKNADVRVHAMVDELAAAEGPCADLFRTWTQRLPVDRPRTVHFHFGRVPTRLAGPGRVAEVFMASGGAATAQPRPLPAQLVLTAVGSRGRPVPGLPFDEERGVVPHTEGRVRADAPNREYVVGWIKRGPTGVIGTNRADAMATVRTLMADLAGIPEDAGPARPFDDGELEAAVDWAGWTGIDATEVLRGTDRGAARVKVGTWDELLAAAHGDSRGITAFEKG